MFEVIRRIALSLIVSLCIVGLSLHFAVESVGGMPDHFVGGQLQETFDSHEEDQFVLSEPEGCNSAQGLIPCSFAYRLKAISWPLSPPLQPPKSI